MWETIERESSFRFVSMGRVAENKVRGGRMIEVIPIEFLPDADAILSSKTAKDKKQGVNFQGELYTVEIKMGATVPAEWVGATNQVLSDDVMAGEQVRLFKAGDSNKWYWESLGRDDNLRRLETKHYRWSANPDLKDSTPGHDNSYELFISGHDGHITLTTSDANGELAKYVIQINCKEGFLTIEDDAGQHILMDKVNELVELLNASESSVSLDKSDIIVKSADNILLESENITLTCSNLTIGASESLAVDAGDISMKSPKGLFDIGDLTIKGKTKIDGPLTLTSPLVSEAGAAFADVVSAKNI